MAARPTPKKGCQTGNFVSEWFGHRVWPVVDTSERARLDQGHRACPFLTGVTGEAADCVKSARGWSEPYGVCTISSDCNGPRQEWIACPFRVLDQDLEVLMPAIRYKYSMPDQARLLLLPITSLSRGESRDRILDAVNRQQRIFLFSAQKLGGEIDLPETEMSPGASVDLSAIEVITTDENGKPAQLGGHLFFEIQTADFHGSPLHAAAELANLCPKGKATPRYHKRLVEQVEVCGRGVEGPNKANIFKRTIYQMIFKTELARRSNSAGFAILLPVPVWESWRKHLGQPELTRVDGDAGHMALLAPGESASADPAVGDATIYVCDIDTDSSESPQPLHITQRVTCTAHALSYHAFVGAADRAFERHVVDSFRATFAERIERAWAASSQDEATEQRPGKC